MRPDVAVAPPDEVPATLLRVATDERLVAYVRAGSERAFETVFDRHQPAILAFCRRMLGSSADAEDAVQHTFFAAYRDLMRSEKPILLRPWLYTIARHRCVSMLRESCERPMEHLPEPTGDHLSAEVALREHLRATLADVARLPDDQRTALVLAELGDVPYDEIARVLACRRDKVKALVFQARSSLSADRAAREMSCADIREQLATLGGALRHATLRRHLRECDGCRTFRQEIRRQRRPLTAFIPFLPGLGFKQALLGAFSGWSGAGAGAAGATAAALSGASFAAVLLVTAAASGGGNTNSPDSAGHGGHPRAPAARMSVPAEPTGAARRLPRADHVVVPRRRGRTGTQVREATGRDGRPAVGPAERPAPPAAGDIATDLRAPERLPHPAAPEVTDPPLEPRDAAPSRPAREPGASEGRRPDTPVPAHGRPRSAGPTHPPAERAATPAPAGGPKTSQPAQGSTIPAAEPSPPAPSKAGGAGNGRDETVGHQGPGAKP